MINLIVVPDIETENFPSRLIFPLNSEEEMDSSIRALLDISNAGVSFSIKIEEDVMDKECGL
jgi:hypothetical protein